LNPELLQALILCGCVPARSDDYTAYRGCRDYDFFCPVDKVYEARYVIGKYLSIDHVVKRSYVTTLFCTDTHANLFVQIDLETCIDWWGLRIFDLSTAIHLANYQGFLKKIEILRSFFWGKGKIATKVEKFGEENVYGVLRASGFDPQSSFIKNIWVLFLQSVGQRRVKIIYDVVRFFYFEFKLFFGGHGLYLNCTNRDTAQALSDKIASSCGRYKFVACHQRLVTYRALRDYSNSAVVLTCCSSGTRPELDYKDEKFFLREKEALIFEGADIVGFLQNYRAS